MKIGIVSPYNIYLPGGVQEVVFATHKELKKRGHDVRIIAPHPRTKPKKLYPDTIHLGQARRVKFNAPFYTEFDVAASGDTDDIIEMLEAEKFDILHVHEPWLPFLGLQLLQHSNTLTLGTLHAKWPESFINRSLERAITPYVRRAVKRLDGITAVSPVSAEYVKTITTKPVTVVPNGIDLSLWKRTIKPLPEYQDDIKTILFVGRLEKRKGAHLLLNAYREMAKEHDNLRLVIAGEGQKKRQLRTYVDRYELPRVEFLGYVDEDTKRRLFASCDVYCSPAPYGESFGIVLLEAMTMNAVTVAGNNPGYASVMQGRGRLSLIDPEDIDAFVHRLELMLFDDEIRNLWRQWAADYVKQYDYARVVDQYEAVYKQLLKDHARSKA